MRNSSVVRRPNTAASGAAPTLNKGEKINLNAVPSSMELLAASWREKSIA